MNGVYTILLLILSNVFMTFAWYGHLRLQQSGVSTNWPLYLVIAFSWMIAFFEYCCQVPANRIGFIDNGGPFNLVQLKVIQECISLVVFAVIANLIFQHEQLHWNHAAAALCLVAAVYFVFMKPETAEKCLDYTSCVGWGTVCGCLRLAASSFSLSLPLKANTQMRNPASTSRLMPSSGR